MLPIGERVPPRSDAIFQSVVAPAPAGRLRQIVKRAARRAGIDARRIGLHSQPEQRRARLLDNGAIDLVLDVGANRGDYGKQLRDCGYRGRLISFEPLSAPYALLADRSSEDPSWDCRQLALGRQTATSTIHVAANDGASSSLLDMSVELRAIDETVRYVGSEAVEVRSLDAVAAEFARPDDRVWLKIDVQGYELEVLDGAADTLASVHGLEIEMSLIALYDGQPLLHEMLEVIGALGFELVDVEPAYRDPRSGRVLQVDGIALRKDRSAPLG